MTPDQFSHTTLAWIAAIASIVGPFSGLVALILAAVANNRSKINELRLNGHSNTLEKVLLNTPPPGSQPIAMAVSTGASGSDEGGTTTTTTDGAGNTSTSVTTPNA